VTVSILADEAVERVVVTALRSNGYRVTVADERYGEGTVDEDLLLDATAHGELVLTHDRDFTELAGTHDHAGVLLSVSHSPDPGMIVRAIDDLLAVFTPESLQNELIYIDDWASS